MPKIKTTCADTAVELEYEIQGGRRNITRLRNLERDVSISLTEAMVSECQRFLDRNVSALATIHRSDQAAK